MGQMNSTANMANIKANKLNLATYRQKLITELTSGKIQINNAFYYLNNIVIDAYGKISCSNNSTQCQPCDNKKLVGFLKRSRGNILNIKLCDASRCDYQFAINIHDYDDVRSFLHPRDPRRMENVDARFYFTFYDDFVISKICPHFPVPIADFECVNDIGDPQLKVIVTEHADGGYITEFISDDENLNKTSFWEIGLFQILYTLASIYNFYPEFRHRQSTLSNWKIRKIPTSTKFNIYNVKDEKYYIIPNNGFEIILTNFTSASIPKLIDNENSYGVRLRNVVPEKYPLHDLSTFASSVLQEIQMDKQTPSLYVDVLKSLQTSRKDVDASHELASLNPLTILLKATSVCANVKSIICTFGQLLKKFERNIQTVKNLRQHGEILREYKIPS